MIFVTVGEQLPFDRLINTIDVNAKELPHTVFAQIGHTSIAPKHITYKQFISPKEYSQKLLQSDMIIAHAGMGTIISAIEHHKPIIVMPRKCSLGEHRNDHQFATVKRFGELGHITVANDENELTSYLLDIENYIRSWKGKERISVSNKLLETIKNFIFTK